MTSFRTSLASLLLIAAVPTWAAAQGTSGTSSRTSGTSGSTSSASSSSSTGGSAGQLASPFGSSSTGAGAAGGAGGGGSSGSGLNQPQFIQFGQAGANMQSGFIGRGNNTQGFIGNANAGQQTVDAGGTARFSGLGGGGGGISGGQASTSQTRGSQMRIPQRISFPIPQIATPTLTSNVQTQFGRLDGAAAGVTVVADASGNVVLQGTVADEHARKLAEALARLEPGVRKITNELQVQSAGSNSPPPRLGR